MRRLAIGAALGLASATALAAPNDDAVAVARVDVAFREGRALVTTDVLLPRGVDATSPIQVGFGTPGLPAAFSAELLPLPPDALGRPLDDHGVPVAATNVARPPPHPLFVLGRPTLTGATIQLPADDLAKAQAASGTAILRLRAVHAIEPGSPPSVVVRLAAERTRLGAVTVHGASGVTLTKASAELCQRDQPSIPLILADRPVAPGAVLPAKATPRPGDDLCVRVALLSQLTRHDSLPEAARAGDRGGTRFPSFIRTAPADCRRRSTRGSTAAR